MSFNFFNASKAGYQTLQNTTQTPHQNTDDPQAERSLKQSLLRSSSYKILPMAPTSVTQSEKKEKLHKTLFSLIENQDWHSISHLIDQNKDDLSFLELHRPLVVGSKIDVYALKNAATTFSASGKSDFFFNSLLHSSCLRLQKLQGRNGLTALIQAGAPHNIICNLLKACDEKTRKTLLTIHDGSGSLPLGLALQRNREDVIELFLEFGASINQQDVTGETALTIAVRQQKTEVVELLCSKGADPLIQNQNGHSALDVWCLHFESDSDVYIETFVIMIAKTAKPEDTLQSTLVQALYNHASKECIVYLAEKNLLTAEHLVSWRDSKGNTLAHIAASAGNLDVLTWLLENKKISLTVINANEERLLHCAAKNGHSEVVAYLITKDETLVFPREKSGISAFDFAVTYGHTECVDLLWQKHPPSPDRHKQLLQDSVNNKHASLVSYLIHTQNIPADLSLLYQAINLEAIEVFDVILKAIGQSIDFVNSEGETPLIIAAKKQKNAMIEALLSKRFAANPFAQDKQGNTFLHYVVQKGDGSLFENGYIPYLSKADAGKLINIGDQKGWTPLHSAFMNKKLAIMDFFISQGGVFNPPGQVPFMNILAKEYGDIDTCLSLARAHQKLKINLNATDEHGNTFMHHLARIKQVHPSKFLELIKCGADMTLQNEDGNTPLHIVAQNEQSTIGVDRILFIEQMTFYDYIIATSLKYLNVFIQNKKGKTAAYYYARQGKENIFIPSDVQRSLRSIPANNGRTVEDVLNRQKSKAQFIKPSIPQDAPLFVLRQAIENQDIQGLKAQLQKAREIIEKGISEEEKKEISKFLPLDLNIQDSEGNTCLHVAMATQNIKIVKLLIEAGADINKTNAMGRTPLHIAALQPLGESFLEVSFMQRLLQKKWIVANLSIQDKKGKTASYLYARNHPK